MTVNFGSDPHGHVDSNLLVNKFCYTFAFSSALHMGLFHFHHSKHPICTGVQIFLAHAVLLG
jgi:hypothetical protein